VEFQSDAKALEDYESDLIGAIKKLNSTQLEVAASSSSLDMSDIGHKIYLIRRKGQLPGRGVEVSPISDYISSLLSIQVRDFDRGEQIRIYKIFSAIAGSRGMAGNLFEGFGQGVFQDGIHIDFFPMIRLSDARNAKRRHQWHSTHVKLRNADLEKARSEALMQKDHLSIKPSSIIIYKDDKDLEISSDVFYMPGSTNQVALDSFIVHRGYLYMFQFTIGRKHPIKKGIIPFLEECRNPPIKKNWKFIFVIPDDAKTLKCPFSLFKGVKDLKLFSATLKVHRASASTTTS
jgi:hypothetical protein